MSDDDVLFRAGGVTLAYAGRPVLRDVTLAIRRGEYWFLLGPNGSGKTTLLRAVLGLLPASAGAIWGHPEHARRERIGFVPQRCEINRSLPTTVREFVLLGLVGLRVAPPEREERLAAALEQVGLGALAGRDYWALSGGQRQRVLLARALVRRPEILLLDEPENNLDPTVEGRLLDVLAEINRRRRITILYVTHAIDIARRYGTHVALLCDGTVVAGARAAVLTPANLTRAFGVAVGAEAASGAVEGDRRGARA